MRRAVLWIPVLLVATFLFVLCGPLLIRWLYFVSTPQAKFEEKIAEYRRLDQQEAGLNGAKLKESQMQRYQVYLWLFARGRDIDGGDGETTLFTPWSYLIRYWENDDGSRFFQNQ